MLNTILVSSAIKIAADVLPSLATKIGGKNAEKVAREVVDTALTTVGMGKDATPEEVIAELHQNDPARQELRLKFEQLENREREMEFADLQDARRYQLESGSMRGNILLAFAGLGLLICVVIVWRLPPENAASLGLITTVAGAFLKMISDAFSFEFGSSRGSKSKEMQISRFQNQLEQVGLENLRRGRLADAEPDIEINESGQGDVNVSTGSSSRASSAPRSPDEPRNLVRMLVEGTVDLS